MAVITKGEAQKLTIMYSSQFPQRVLSALQGNASVGVIGGVFSYGNTLAADIAKTVTGLQALGWAVAQDDVGQTLTVS